MATMVEIVRSNENHSSDSTIGVGSGHPVKRGVYNGHLTAIKTIDTVPDAPLDSIRSVINQAVFDGLPGFVSYYGCEKISPTQAIIYMELVNGKTIAEFHKEIQRRELSSAKKEDIFKSLWLQGTYSLLQLEGIGWIHNDIKKENLMVMEQPDDTFQLIFIDYELSKPSTSMVDRFMELWSLTVTLLGLLYPVPTNCREPIDNGHDFHSPPLTIITDDGHNYREITRETLISQLAPCVSQECMNIIRMVLLADASGNTPTTEYIHVLLTSLIWR